MGIGEIWGIIFVIVFAVIMLYSIQAKDDDKWNFPNALVVSILWPLFFILFALAACWDLWNMLTRR